MSYSVSFKRLNEQESQHVEKILNDINPILKKWGDIFRDQKFRHVRNKIFNAPTELNVPQNLAEEYQSDARKIAELRKPQPELGNRTVEEAMLDGFSKMAYKFAHSYLVKAKPDCLTIDDLLQECLFKIYEATYRWMPEKGMFSTFLFSTLHRHMQLVINHNRFLSPINKDGINIFSRFLKAVHENENLNDFEVVETMGLTKDEKSHLYDVMNSMNICRESAVESKGNDNRPDRDILDGLREIDNINESDLVIEKMYVQEIIERANLSPMELDLLNNAMNPYHGWQRDFREKYPSPVTKRPYSKQRISQMVNALQLKLARTLERLGDKQS